MPLPAEFEKKLWAAADQLWTNSALQPSEYSTPVLALIFLKYADHRFAQAEKQLAGKTRRRGAVGKDDYHGLGVLYVPEQARFRRLLELPEGADIGKTINEAMKAIEAENDELKDVLPKTYGRFGAQTLKELLKLFGTIPEDVEGDVFGRIYEYFLGNFAPRTLQKGGEYFTPYSVVRLIVEIVEPYQGRVLDPCCGSGGMFVQSASFVAAHEKKAAEVISVYGVEKVEQTRRLARMNLAAYEDLIENNTKRIKILEEMARSLYREWFVRFRFPGHEKVKLVEMPIGPVPQGWTTSNLFEVATVTYGFPFKSKLFSETPTGTPIVRIRDLVASETHTYSTEDVEEKHYVGDGDVLVGMDGNFHMCKWSGGQAALNQRVVMFRPRLPVSRYFLLLALEAPIKHLESTITGTTVAHLSDKDLRRLTLLIAPPQLQGRFDDAVDAMYEQEVLLRRQSRNLRATRDILLPRLLSGEIDVSSLPEPAV